MRLQEFSSYTFFPGQHWSHTWERQHELVTRFAKLLPDKELAICAPTGLLNHNPLSIGFLKRIIDYYHQVQAPEILNPIEPNMRMCDVKRIPFHNKIFGKINFNLMNHDIKISRNNFFWATYMNPAIYEFFKRSGFRIYDIAERRSKNPHLNKNVLEWERKAVKEADLVIIDNHATIKDYEGLNPNMYYIPQGVNPDTFHVLDNDVKREFIGYIGNLHFAIDYNFLRELILNNSDEKFMIIGGIMESKAEMILNLPNVTYIPPVQKNSLNEYLAQMKIGLIPYIVNDHTVGVYPTKLFEYLSAGVPVVSTPLPEVVQYADDDYLKIISTPDNLSALCFKMVKSADVIKNNTWDRRWAEYLNLIQQC